MVSLGRAVFWWETALFYFREIFSGAASGKRDAALPFGSHYPPLPCIEAFDIDFTTHKLPLQERAPRLSFKRESKMGIGPEGS